jgi:hypothetical protein
MNIIKYIIKYGMAAANYKFAMFFPTHNFFFWFAGHPERTHINGVSTSGRRQHQYGQSSTSTQKERNNTVLTPSHGGIVCFFY